MLLAGDIGGTKTHLGVFSPYGDPREPLHAATLPSGRYPDPETMIREFLAEARLPVTAVCLGVAGPVREGAADITNLPWRLSVGRLRDLLGTPSVRVVNDVEAMAWAIPALGPADLEVLSPGEPPERGTLARSAPGSGLGEAFLTWSSFECRGHPSEGGHVDVAPAGEQQAALLTGLQARLDHVGERQRFGVGLDVCERRTELVRRGIDELVAHLFGQLLLCDIAHRPDVCFLLDGANDANWMAGNADNATLAVLLAGKFRHDGAIMVVG